MFEKLKNLKKKDNMALHKVYIAYSTKDTEIANELCHFLEENDLRCWIAPRNIRSGKNYVEEIMGGIDGARVVVLLFSQYSNESKYVKSEIEYAFSKEKHIFALNIDESLPCDEMEFILRNVFWINAYNDREEAFKTLLEQIRYLIYN